MQGRAMPDAQGVSHPQPELAVCRGGAPMWAARPINQIAGDGHAHVIVAGLVAVAQHAARQACIAGPPPPVRVPGAANTDAIRTGLTSDLLAGLITNEPTARRLVVGRLDAHQTRERSHDQG